VDGCLPGRAGVLDGRRAFQVLPPSADDQTRTDVAVTLVNFRSGPWEPPPALTSTVVVLLGAAWLRLPSPVGRKRVMKTGATIDLAGSALKCQPRGATPRARR
jgi:hypothetical protein